MVEWWGKCWSILVLVFALACPAFSQEPNKEDLFDEPTVEQQLSALMKRVAKLEADNKKLKSTIKELRSDVVFLTEEYLDEDDDEEDDFLPGRLIDEIDEEMDEEDEEDRDEKYKRWQRQRRMYHHSSKSGLPVKPDEEVEESADLLGKLRENPELWNVYKYHQDIPEYRAAMDAYKAENRKRSEEWFAEQEEKGMLVGGA